MGGVRDVPMRMAAITFLHENPGTAWQEKGTSTAEETEAVATFMQRAVTRLASPDMTVHGATQILRHWASRLLTKSAEELVQNLFHGRVTLQQAG